MLARATLLFDEALNVLGVLDLLAAIPGASMGGDDVVAVHESHGVEVGEGDERALGSVVGNGIVVEVEPAVGGLADLDLDPLEGRKRLVRELEQSAALFLVGLADRATAILDPAAIQRVGVRPIQRLPIEIGEVVNLRASKKASRMYRIARSTRPFSLPRATATGRGSNR
jgi:hypothetical protein